MKDDLVKFIDELRNFSAETEWLEFKARLLSSNEIGEYISALANSATLHQRQEAYLIFGIKDKTHEVVGTKFDPKTTKGKGNEDLEPWLHRKLKPNVEFEIREVLHPQGRVMIFFIQPSMNGPIRFDEKKFIRIGSCKKNLNDYPEKEAIIWERRIPFEKRIALENVKEYDVLKLLDYEKYFQLTKSKRLETEKGIIDKFLQEDFLLRANGKLNISNLGAILLARNLSDFTRLENKAIRIIAYNGTDHLNAIKDVSGNKGYAVGFDNVISYIKSQVPEYEKIEKSLRETTLMYPTKTIREFVANALVHQDFSIKGSNIIVEIFSDRIEILNPGRALIEPDRFMDSEPRSRNEKLTDTLRRMNVCEKRGSGVDRAVVALELAQFPAPKIENKDDSVKVTIYSKKQLNELTREEKSRACYFHSCVKYCIDQEAMTNSSLCERLGIKDKNKAIASRIIKDALEKGYVKHFDPDSKTRKYAKYIPYWV